MSEYAANWWHVIDDGRIQCDLCPRECKLQEGQQGLCFVRARRGDKMVLDTWGRSSGFCIDPIEKKPLNHFYPGTSVLSFGTAGCNLFCKFCQNWDISKSRDIDKLSQQASPQQLAQACLDRQVPAVAFTYNDPVIFAEYALDIADSCHELGIRTVAVTAGYIHAAPRRSLFAKMNAANVDLKAFTPSFYEKLCGGNLRHVLDTLLYIRHQTRCWLEITTLLIPNANDSPTEIKALSQWIYRELGADVPLHFTAFHPDFKLTDRSATPPATLQLARTLALEQGLRYVYTGNIHDPAGGTTHCPQCQHILIVRDWHQITHYALKEANHCPACGYAIAGHFDKIDGAFKQFGRQRIPVSIAPTPRAVKKLYTINFKV